MNMPIVSNVVLSLFVALPLAACSTAGSDQMDAGQRISERGGDISARGQSWTDGQRDQREGQKLVARSVDQISDGEKALKRAQAAVAKAERQIEAAWTSRTNGEQLVSSGTLKMQKAEADYAAIKNGPSAIAPQ